MAPPPRLNSPLASFALKVLRLIVTLAVESPRTQSAPPSPSATLLPKKVQLLIVTVTAPMMANAQPAPPVPGSVCSFPVKVHPVIVADATVLSNTAPATEFAPLLLFSVNVELEIDTDDVFNAKIAPAEAVAMLP